MTLDLLDISEKLADVLGLEGQILVVAQDVLLAQCLSLGLSLSLVLLASILFLLDGFVKECNDRLDLVAKEVLLAFIGNKLDTNNFAKITEQSSLVVNS